MFRVTRFRLEGVQGLCKHSADDPNENGAWIISQNMGYTNY